MTVITLSTYITNTVRYIRHVSQAFKIRHSCSVHYTKSLLNLFQAERFDINCSGCISEDLRTVTQNPHVPTARARPLKPLQFGSLIPPILRKKSVPLYIPHKVFPEAVCAYIPHTQRVGITILTTKRDSHTKKDLSIFIYLSPFRVADTQFRSS